MLFFDFSRANAGSGTLEENFNRYCCAVLNDFMRTYAGYFDGQWREALSFIAQSYKENSSIRSTIEGERNLQGFFTAYLSINSYYLLAPELELNHGFCDLFLMPDLRHYEVAHSYIIEMKYLSSKDSEAKANQQW